MLPFSKCGSKQIVAFRYEHCIYRNTVIDSLFTHRKATTTRGSEVFEADVAKSPTMYRFLPGLALCEAEAIVSLEVPLNNVSLLGEVNDWLYASMRNYAYINLVR